MNSETQVLVRKKGERTKKSAIFFSLPNPFLSSLKIRISREKNPDLVACKYNCLVFRLFAAKEIFLTLYQQQQLQQQQQQQQQHHAPTFLKVEFSRTSSPPHLQQNHKNTWIIVSPTKMFYSFTISERFQYNNYFICDYYAFFTKLKDIEP